MTDPKGRLVSPPVAPTAHLDDAEIAGVTSRPGSEKHLADCALCRSRRARFENGGAEALHHLLADLDATPVSEDAVKATSQWHIPTRLVQLLDSAPEDFPAVAPGQLWRLSWGGEQALVAIVRRDRWNVRVMPVTTDVVFADEYTVVLDEDDTCLGNTSAVFGRAATTVPTLTLAQFLGDVTVNGTPARDVLEPLDGACIRGRRLELDVPTGTRLGEPDWETHELLDALQEQMQWFAAAVSDVPELNDDDDADSSADVVEIQHALASAAREIDLSDLAERTGVGMGRLVDLLGGRSRPSPEEVSSLSAALGRKVSSGVSPADLAELVVAVSEPALRALRSRFNEQIEPSADPASIGPLVSRLLEEGMAARTSSSGDGEPTSRRKWQAALAYLQQHY